MRKELRIALAGFVGLVTAVSACSPRAAAPAAPQHPDISGMWVGAGKSSWSSTRAKVGEEPDIPCTAWSRERMKGLVSGSGGDSDFENATDPALKYADPLGFPRQYQHPVKFKIVQTDDHVYQMWEWNKVWRQIPLTRPLSEDPDITWYGESAGKWEGDTLRVDSAGFKDSTWLDGVGHPHSEQLHVTERIRRVDAETLHIDFTFEDPIAYTRPWTAQHDFKAVHDDKMGETITTMSDELLYRERFLNQKPAIAIRR